MGEYHYHHGQLRKVGVIGYGGRNPIEDSGHRLLLSSRAKGKKGEAGPAFERGGNRLQKNLPAHGKEVWGNSSRRTTPFTAKVHDARPRRAA